MLLPFLGMVEWSYAGMEPSRIGAELVTEKGLVKMGVELAGSGL